MSLKRYRDILKLHGIDLASMHVNALALDRNWALAALPELDGTGVPVLGGDAIMTDSMRKLVYSYDNWYCQQKEGESIDDYCARSIRASVTYIENYTGRGSLFEIVLGDDFEIVEEFREFWGQ